MKVQLSQFLKIATLIAGVACLVLFVITTLAVFAVFALLCFLALGVYSYIRWRS